MNRYHVKKIYLFFKSFFTKRQLKVLAKNKRWVLSQYNYIRCFINELFFKHKLLKNRKLHIGCGNVKFLDFINIDYRATKATDLVHNCSRLNFLPKNWFDIVFANAFLEHLFFKDRIKCLNSIYKVLNKQGKVIILGIPDFKRTAQAYLKKENGIVSKVFDLFEVYRYTHGDPEQYPEWWLEQLHKSLFDVETLNKLLIEAQFKQFTIFRYCFKREKVALTLGFIAFKLRQNKKISKQFVLGALKEMPAILNKSTLKLLIIN